MNKKNKELTEIQKRINSTIKYLKTTSLNKTTLNKLIDDINELQIASSNKNESLIRTALYSISDAVITTDIKGRIQQMNPLAEKLCSWKETEAKGQLLDNVLMLINELTRKKCDNPVKKVLKNNHNVALTNHTLLISKKGKEIPVTVSVTELIKNAKGKVLGVILIFRDQTEERKKHTVLLESETRYKSLFDNSPDAIFLADPKTGKIIDANKAALQLIKMPHSKVVGLHQTQLHPQRLTKYSKKTFRDQIKNIELKIPLENFLITSSGEEIPIEILASEIIINGKKVIQGVFRNITERRRIEAALSGSQEMLRNVVEQFPGVVFWKDVNSKYLGCNQTFADSAGLKNSSEIEGKTDFDLPWAKTEAKAYRADDQQVMTKNKIKLNIIESLHQADNKITWFDTSKIPLKDNNGNVVGVLGISNDITDRMRAEEALRESEISYRGLFNSVSESIYIQNENGVFLDVNEGALTMYGYDRETLIGKTPDFVSAPWKNDLESIGLMVKKAFLGEKQQFEFWGKRKNGEEFLKDVRLYPGTYLNNKVIIAIATDITEKKNIEKALALSEERYRAISSLTSDYLFSTEADKNGVHKIVWIAGSFEKITGYTIEEYKNIGGWRATLYPEELEFDDLDLEKLKRNKKVNREIRTYHKNGSLVWVKSHAQPIWDNRNNKLIGVYGAVEDITLRKQTEIVQKIQYNIADAVVTFKTLTELFESIRKELSEIINVNNFFIALYDEKTGMLRSDVDKDEVEEIDEWTAKGSMTGYVIEQNKSILLKKNEINDLISTGKAGMIGVIPEIWLGVPFKIGGIVFGVLVVQSYNNPNAYDQKSLEILEIVAHELSLFIKHKKAEEETLKLSTAVVQSPTIIIITDPKGNIEYVNPKFSEVTGYSQEEAKWKNPRILNSGFHDKIFFSDLWKTILAGKIWQGELKNKKKSGELYWENALISPIIDSEGNITNFVAVKEDITDKKKMIEELIIAKETAEEMNRVKSSFFANMSHELRTPMVGILGFSEVLSNELKDNPEYFHMISSINTSGHRLLETLNLILNLSKLEASKVEFNLKPQNIIPILKESFGFFESAAAKKNIDYKFVSEHTEIVCSIDQLLFTSIFNNLLNNAIKFTDSGSAILNVSTDSEYATISVSDTGVGISEAKQNLIWEEFRQASEGYNRGFEGTGLGLTIAKKYTHLMNGSVSVKSMLDKGTTFTVSFPLTNKSSNLASTVKDPLTDEQIKNNQSYN